MTLSPEEIIFFAENGYLIKRSVLNPDLMAQARECWWAAAPPELNRNDPDTWVGAFKETRWTLKYRDQQEEPWLVQMMAKDPAVRRMAVQLLGDDLQEATKVRGIYCVFPEGDAPKRPPYCHVDQHPFHLGVVGYIDEVPPGGGGFTVWPGTHKQFYHTFKTRYSFEPTKRYKAVRDSVLALEPVETFGQAGDIVFWHHRIAHSAGHNRSRQIRQAVLYDFKKNDLAETQDQPPHDDMWLDWPGVAG